MSDLITMPRAVAEQVLEALLKVANAKLADGTYADKDCKLTLAITALRAALAQQEQTITPAELSAALGWPGGISTPVLGKVKLLRMVAQQDVLEAEVERLRKATQLCDKHAPNGGTVAACVICSGQKLSHALSRISYLCEPPNEMECSSYDLHYIEDAVVAQVERLRALNGELLEALEAMLSHTADLDPMQGYRPEEDFSAVKQARAAIAKAEGQR